MTRAKAKFSRPLKPLKTGRKAGTKKASSRTAPPRALLKAIPGNHAKARHMRDRRGHLHAWDGRLPTGLVAKPIVAQPKSKHRSYFEFVENREKKKKLEFKVARVIKPDRIDERTLTVNRSPTTENRPLATSLFL